MSRGKILLVEDDAIVRMDLERYLRAQDFEIAASYEYAEDAVENIPKSQPDLVLTDIILKGDMDGVDAARVIKSQYGIPIVFLTAYYDELSVHRAKQTGPQGFLLKPYDKGRLLWTIERALEKRSTIPKPPTKEPDTDFVFKPKDGD